MHNDTRNECSGILDRSFLLVSGFFSAFHLSIGLKERKTPLVVALERSMTMYNKKQKGQEIQQFDTT